MKSSLFDLQSGVTMVSEAIDQHEMNPELHLLRAKLLLKMVRTDNL